MEKQNLLLKLSRLFPSCQSRSLPDVAHSSIFITKPINKTPHIQNHRKITTAIPSDAEGRKCPPVTPASTLNPTKTDNITTKNHSSSSNSGRWFTSSDEKLRAAPDGFDTDTFYSLSSNSGDSLRPKTTSRRFRRCDEIMNRIDDTVPSRKMGSDQDATQLYYSGSCRRRRAAKGRRRRRRSRSLSEDPVMEEGFAVEKSTRDPYGDFMSSMVEMIIEKRLFGKEDLDRLLFCLLALNKEDYHGIIFDVFSDICQTLFCN